ncbi:sugar-transfer associated ATP-grasp domain-containing protein [Pseudazoarcus pumilus]|uniref:Alpha-L-glutamate ligase-related protein ATP-grasp domain-containing protein n=1 Tax=Pseudazoarcus pumilus TaxID=2067960 RepID=A0A2I6S514_9RHOO|nr:sugar-transfer associated ATP-grasp domain-containing protein [Pseudazoarcus pumilus]AUN94353.1 hypothetical protein C0099_05005 [Pseudazoarcus pumilus]
MAALIFRYASRWRNLRYHIRNAPWDELHAYERQRSGRSWLPWRDLLLAAWRHGASFDDYYLLRFFEKSRAQRREYLTLSLYYELERQKNRLDKAMILRDKARFARHFRDLLGRRVWTWEELCRLDADERPPDRLVIKNRWGVRGRGIHFPEQRFPDWAAVRAHVAETVERPEHYLCEAYVHQHPLLAALNPGTVNTLRVVTWQAGGQVSVWGTILRVGRGRGPDNWARGGLAAWVDDDGTISRLAVPKNPFEAHVETHADSRLPITGLSIPGIDEIRRLAIESANRLPEVQSIGWDIALGQDGPCLIEGNDRWSHQLLQATLGHGCRHLADAVGEMHQVYE